MQTNNDITIYRLKAIMHAFSRPTNTDRRKNNDNRTRQLAKTFTLIAKNVIHKTLYITRCGRHFVEKIELLNKNIDLKLTRNHSGLRCIVAL